MISRSPGMPLPPRAILSRLCAAREGCRSWGFALRGAPRREAAMSTLKAVNPPGWARPKGYSNGVVGRGSLVFVAGQVGWNAEERFESDDFVAQVRHALLNT